ncbi:MAG TPA: Ig-like domain-containing protein [Anaeromyxobacter sp.]|nr:Ig-like domain-containing protein [Anaeromyxobacter sp.]
MTLSRSVRGSASAVLALLLLSACGGGGGSDPGPRPECSAPTDCAGTDGDCQWRTCTAGTCGVAYADAGTVVSTQTVGDCRRVECNGTGGTTSVAQDTDLPADDGNQCTGETCSGGVPAHPNQPLWTPCDQNGGNACSAAGECIHSTDAQIAAVRAAADGTGLSLPVEGATVTYLKPAIGGEPAGFFVQSYAAGGPAVFVAIDPATLVSAEPAPGDIVSFTVVTVATVNQLRRVTAVAGWDRVGSGQALPAAQDVSNDASIISAPGDLESELVTAVVTVASIFSPAGSGMSAAFVVTNGVPAMHANLELRVDEAVRAAAEVAPGCRVRVGPTPLWRFDATAQLSAWYAGDLEPWSCPAPRVVSAVALSADSVEISFDRRIAPASVAIDGSQFALSGGLVAVGAAAFDTTVVVTTSAQTPGASYGVTVAPTVRDLLGNGVDGAANGAAFEGYRVPAVLAISEVNPNIPGGADLAELRVVTAGWGEGITFESGAVSRARLATLPRVELAEGDLVVVHLNAAGLPTELASKTQCGAAACYPDAWDVTGGLTGISDKNAVLSVWSARGVLLDAVPFSDGTIPSSQFATDLQDIQARGFWLPADCGGALCTAGSTPTAVDVSASWAGVDPSAVGSSVQWRPGTAGDQAADWTVDRGPADARHGERPVTAARYGPRSRSASR